MLLPFSQPSKSCINCFTVLSNLILFLRLQIKLKQLAGKHYRIEVNPKLGRKVYIWVQCIELYANSKTLILFIIMSQNSEITWNSDEIQNQHKMISKKIERKSVDTKSSIKQVLKLSGKHFIATSNQCLWKPFGSL